MKTVITAAGNNVSAAFDKRFGRAAWFCVYDHANGALAFEKNDFADAQGGAGTKVSELMVEWGVGKVISGDFGPKAKDLLDRFKVQMVVVEEDATVETLLERIKKQ
ncbi:MAG TPA: dinitrogenase iron-molybdenum cofactor biosynthesis protein [Bacteroidales bacterium]|jgi:predicted Fe-Mo cluster-binding NifX family protein|nr:dinitrogenase iron-molybdenum cofactor biosynthesis protein [Bacteroidales bacterium]